MDRQEALSAFQQLEARLQAIPRDRLHEPRIHPQRAALAAMQVARVLQRPEVRERFVALAGKGCFELRLLDDLPLAARAAWHARQQLDEASQTSERAQVPLLLFQQSTALRARMLKVLDYHLGEEPALAAKLAAIRGGKGQLDLANDLRALADLYRLHQAELADDRRHFRVSDEEDARAAAEGMLRALSGTGPEVARWADLSTRSFALLQQTYDEVRRAGHWLFYFEEPEELFPSLFAAARAARDSS